MLTYLIYLTVQNFVLSILENKNLFQILAFTAGSCMRGPNWQILA